MDLKTASRFEIQFSHRRKQQQSIQYCVILVFEWHNNEWKTAGTQRCTFPLPSSRSSLKSSGCQQQSRTLFLKTLKHKESPSLTVILILVARLLLRRLCLTDQQRSTLQTQPRQFLNRQKIQLTLVPASSVQTQAKVLISTNGSRSTGEVPAVGASQKLPHALYQNWIL